MARLMVKVLHDPGDRGSGGVAVTVDGKQVNLSQGEGQEFSLPPGGLHFRAMVVDSRGVPIDNIVSVGGEPGKSRTDPRTPDGAASPPGGTQSEPGNLGLPTPANQPPAQAPTPAAPNTLEQQRAAAVNPETVGAASGGGQATSATTQSPPSQNTNPSTGTAQAPRQETPPGQPGTPANPPARQSPAPAPVHPKDDSKK